MNKTRKFLSGKGYMFLVVVFGIFMSNCVYVSSSGISYCAASSQDYWYEYIAKVELNAGSKSSLGSTYSDYTGSVFTTLDLGQQYTLRVTGRTTDNYRECVKAWIDFNRDGDFFDSEEEIDMGCHQFSGEYTFSKTFTVPSDAKSGHTRMRVALRWVVPPPSCGTFGWGEVEDYTINIKGDDYCKDNGHTQRCYTDDGCIGSQICIKNKWSTCLKDDFCCNIFNGNFENGMNGWEWSYYGDYKVSSENRRSGSYSALIGFKDSENIVGSSQIWANIKLPLSGKVYASFWYNFYSYDAYPYDEFIGIVGNGSIGGKNQIIGRTSYGFDSWGTLKSTGWMNFEKEIGEVEAGDYVFFHFDVSNRYDTYYKSWAFIDDAALYCIGCPICRGACVVPIQKIIINVHNTEHKYRTVYDVTAVDLCNNKHTGRFFITHKNPVRLTGDLQPPYHYNITVTEAHTGEGFGFVRRGSLFVPIVASESPIELSVILPHYTKIIRR